jgi:hypothetical protein
MTSKKADAAAAAEIPAQPSYVESLTAPELTAHIASKRDELAATLNELELKFNLQKQVDLATVRLERRLAHLRREHPLAVMAVGVGAAAIAALVVVASVRSAFTPKK